MRHVVIGAGEVGSAVIGLLRDGNSVSVIDKDPTKTVMADEFNHDVMHICIPYSRSFVEDVREYVDRMEPKRVLIWSSVPIGTTREVSPDACHTLVEGKHPDILAYLQTMVRWIGGSNMHNLSYLCDLFTDLGLAVKPIGSSNFTEFLKLRSTSKYGINLAWTDYEARTAEKLGMPFELVNEFDTEYNKLYRDAAQPQFQRYILTDPKGEIGGHCVVANAKLLNEQHPSELLEMIIKMEKK